VADGENVERGARLRAVREEYRDAGGAVPSQVEFGALLQRVAVEIFGANVEHKYGQSLVNRLEKGKQPPTLQDLEVYEAIDQSKRSRGWLAWGEPVLDLSNAKPVSDAAKKRAETLTARDAVKAKPGAKKKAGRRGNGAA
jgi:hypothetical protein